ncbi:lambda-exonuclease family protein [Candidatus Merdisoma sp. JLR.KK006]|uniref:YqaJ viral recombinase family nuclease n=1 Tax=Candidatus Merdisoma sp. JLR.KK006 TaxID=3112626 RepID=UPI002FEF940F
MYTKIPTAGMSREAWLKLRKTGIGGSDTGAICGLNPYSSSMKVYQDKTCTESEEIDNESIRQGHDLEDYVAQRFMEATGFKVRRSNYMYRSTEHPFMIADVDRLIVGEDAGLECKTASAYNADKWKDGNIPLHYLMQCYHYMAVTGKRTWYIAAVILGQKFLYHKLEWDDALISELIEVEQYFWENHVQKGIMPKPDGSEACDAVLNHYFKRAEKFDILKLSGFDEKLHRREAIVEAIDRLKKEQSQIEQEVKLCMKDHEKAVSEAFRISWSNVESTRLDTEKIKKERPEIYQDYAKVSSSRRFQIKAA